METSSSTSDKPKVVPTENWWAEAWAVFRKDLTSEMRTRAAMGAIFAFAFTTTLLVSFTVRTEGLGLTTGLVQNLETGASSLDNFHTKERALLLSNLYWMILYFSAMTGLSRAFLKEEEMRTAPILRLTARPSAVFAGKVAFNFVLIEAVALLLLPLFFFFFKPQVHNWPALVAHVMVGAATIAGASTIMGAMVSRAANSGYLMVILGFGPLLPILVLAINGTAAAVHGSVGNNLVGLVSYLIVMTVASGWLFEHVWRD